MSNTCEAWIVRFRVNVLVCCTLASLRGRNTICLSRNNKSTPAHLAHKARSLLFEWRVWINQGLYPYPSIMRAVRQLDALGRNAHFVVKQLT